MYILVMAVVVGGGGVGGGGVGKIDRINECSFCRSSACCCCFALIIVNMVNFTISRVYKSLCVAGDDGWLVWLCSEERRRR